MCLWASVTALFDMLQFWFHSDKNNGQFPWCLLEEYKLQVMKIGTYLDLTRYELDNFEYYLLRTCVICAGHLMLNRALK